MENIEKELRRKARKLFDAGEIDLLAGYCEGTLPMRSRPCIITGADDTDGLVWNSFCSNNLAVYLPRLFSASIDARESDKPPRIAIVGKACDVRSAFGLMKENQVPRESVIIIGMPCRGMVDNAGAESAAGGCIRDCSESADAFEVSLTGDVRKTIPRADVIADACLECAAPTAEECDILIPGESRAPAQERFREVEEFETQSPRQRWEYFRNEISKCIRCYACRQACPNCYCKECFADQTLPKWIGTGTNISDLMLYHIGRIFHQAGRCVACDACVRACPVGVDLRTFTRKLVKDVRELFDFVPGFSHEETPPLCTFNEKDSEEFLTEP